MKRNYVVHYKLGSMPVEVDEHYISKYGERRAVAEAAWNKLIGRNNLGQDIKPFNPETRHILMTEMFSQYSAHRPHVYTKFEETIKFTWISIVR